MSLFRILVLSSLSGLLSCSHVDQKSAYENYQAAEKQGRSCGQLVQALSVDSKESLIKSAFEKCYKRYLSLETHAQSIEFLKSTFETLGVNNEEKSIGTQSHLVASIGNKHSESSVVLFHPTDLVHGQMTSISEGPIEYLWGQKKEDVRATGLLQLFSIAMLRKANLRKTVVFVASNHGQLTEILKDFPHAEVVLNEGGVGFEKNKQPIFFLGTEQKGGAWLKLKHKNPRRLMSHLDQLMSVYLPHQPQEFKGMSPCRLASFTTHDKKINRIPDHVTLQLDCQVIDDTSVDQAFHHSHAQTMVRREQSVYTVDVHVSHKDETRLGEISALQIAALGLQRLSVIPYRDWSFEEPGFYSHQKTTASMEFAQKMKDIYSTQSPWGDFLWSFNENRGVANVSSVYRGGHERLFRTTCHWTSFEVKPDEASATVDCRLAHTSGVKGSQAEHFRKELLKKAQDPSLHMELIDGWDYHRSNRYAASLPKIQLVKKEILSAYPQAFVSSWVSPGDLFSNLPQTLLVMGVSPLLKKSFLENKDFFTDDSLNEDGFVKANQVYREIVKKLSL